jgi:hypothetical protein
MNLQDFNFNFLYNFEEKQIAKCECYLDNCLERKIEIYDFITDKFVDLKICNTIIKLYFQNVPSKYDERTHYSDFIQSIIYKYYIYKYDIEVKNHWWGDQRLINATTVDILLSRRPFIYNRFSLEKCFDLLLNCEHLSYCAKENIALSISKSLENYYEKYNFKKNLTRKNQILCNLKKIKNFYSNKELCEIEVLKIINELFLLTIKNKK